MAAVTALVSTVTGSRRLDLVFFVLAAALVIAVSMRVRVYYAVTVVDVQLVRVAADGSREVLPTPAALRTRGGLLPPRPLLRQLRRRIRGYMRDAALPASAATTARYEWVIRYGSNTTVLARRHVFVFPAPKHAA